MTLSASRVADELDRTATLLAQHGEDTKRIVAEWAGIGSASSGGPSSIGSHSDPTQAQALADKLQPRGDMPPLDELNERWEKALGSIVTAYVRIGLASPYAVTRGAEVNMLLHISRTIRPRPTVPYVVLSVLDAICIEITKIIGWTHPMTPEEARQLLFDKAKLANQASYCRACETPGPTKSALCQQCYELRRYHLDNGHPEFADDATFRAHVMHQLTADGGSKLNRPASPHYVEAPTRLHAPRILVCPDCQARQEVTGAQGGSVGCVECGSQMVEAA